MFLNSSLELGYQYEFAILQYRVGATAVCTVELPCATTSRKRAPPISDPKCKTPEFDPVKALQLEPMVNKHLS